MMNDTLTNLTSCESEGRSAAVIGVISLLVLLIMVFTILGNVIVIVAITSYRALKEQQSNLFILNLSVADLFVAVCIMFLSFLSIVQDIGREVPFYSPVLCNIQCAINYCLIVVSMMTLGFISIDRYVHIIHPLHYYDYINASKIRIMIVWTWIQGLIIGFVPVGMGWIHYDYCEMVCAIDWSKEHADKYVIVAFITCFLLPAVTMTICYSCIVKRSSHYYRAATASHEIRKSMKIHAQTQKTGSMKPKEQKLKPSLVSDQSSNGRSDSRQTVVTTIHVDPANPSSPDHNMTQKVTSQHMTIIKSLVCVLVVFMICMTPFSVTKLIKVLGNCVSCWINNLATIIHFSSSVCNPLIYGVFRKEYRTAFKRQFNKVCRRGNFYLDNKNSSRTSASPVKQVPHRNGHINLTDESM